jgi:uncharacterized protein involved in outer membrane biogenesis
MIKNYRKVLIGFAVVIGLLLIVPFLIPTQTYLQQAEKLASEKLGVPVTIQSLHLALLPTPRVAISGAVVGKHDEFKVEKLVVTPTLGSLFSDAKILDIYLDKPIMKKAAVDLMAALSSKKSDNNAPARVHVRHVEVDEVQLIWPNMQLPTMNADATLTAAHTLEFATLKSVDGSLQAEVIPNGDEQLIALNVHKFTLPVGLPLLIDQAKFEMRLQGNKLAVPSFKIALYGGKITGDAQVNWQKSWKASGNFKVDNLAVQQPSHMVSKSVYLSGDLFGNGNFSGAAKQAGQLADNLRMDFKFKVDNGVLHGLDLVKIASLLIKQNQSGGQTQFDAFSGLLSVTGKQYHLRNLNISSGLLAASGQVKVKSNKALDGEVTVDVKNGMGLAQIPLDVSGTVSNPMVLPNKAALAGAIAGTAVLPGVGTSVGIKAGKEADGALKKLKGLFGD